MMATCCSGWSPMPGRLVMSSWHVGHKTINYACGHMHSTCKCPGPKPVETLPDARCPECRKVEEVLGRATAQGMKVVLLHDAMPGEEIDYGPDVVVDQDGRKIGKWERNAPPPDEQLLRIPSIKRADEQAGRGEALIHLRFYNPDGRGEWLVLGFDPPNKGWGWIVSPWGRHCDEYGAFDILAWDYYAKFFGIKEIRRDEMWEPKPWRREDYGAA